MRNKTHIEHIERWGRFVKENPSKWKTSHTEFINAQFKMAERFFDRLGAVPGGKEKIMKLRKMKTKTL